MTTILAFAVAVLWVVVVALAGVVFVMLRQIGVLYERVAPIGAMVDSAGPKVGEAAPAMTLESLTGGAVAIGPAQVGAHEPARGTLVFFLSTTCPVCKKLIPALADIRTAEGGWLDVVLASDGDETRHRAFIDAAGLGDFPYVLSSDLGMTFRIQKLPYAVLIDRDGVVRAKGLVNSREQLESLFNAVETGVASMQEFVARRVEAAE